MFHASDASTIIHIDLRDQAQARAFNPLTGGTHAPGSADAVQASPTVLDLRETLQLVSRYSQFIETVTLLSWQ